MSLEQIRGVHVGRDHCPIRDGPLAILELHSQSDRIDHILNTHVDEGPGEERIIADQCGRPVVILPQFVAEAGIHTRIQPAEPLSTRPAIVPSRLMPEAGIFRAVRDPIRGHGPGCDRGQTLRVQ